jgi:sugar phosphate isomerase/epimerase
MRIGVTTTLTEENLAWAKSLGFGSMAWMRFVNSPANEGADWQPWVDAQAARLHELGLRVSAIGAWYANPLDPRQTERARQTLRRAIAVAERLGVKTVSGFGGGLIDTDINPRGGNPLPRPIETSLEPLLAFWEPLAREAADHGVRLAFENCTQAPFYSAALGYNAMSRPAMWERFFNATTCDNLGLEWDPSHLISQGIDPVENVRRFGRKVFHVHAKDAFVHRRLLALYGPSHPGVVEHRFPGLGQGDWGQIVYELVRAGYDSDLNIEGCQDPVYHDHPPEVESALAGRQLEEAGLRIARETLLRYVPPETGH